MPPVVKTRNCALLYADGVRPRRSSDCMGIPPLMQRDVDFLQQQRLALSHARFAPCGAPRQRTRSREGCPRVVLIGTWPPIHATAATPP